MPTPTRAPRRRVGDPIILRLEHDGPEMVIRPCSGKHRNFILRGLISIGCTRCGESLVKLDESEWAS